MKQNEKAISHSNNDFSKIKKRLKNKRNKNDDVYSMSKEQLIDEIIKVKKQLELLNKTSRNTK